ncbi:MAG: tol-pal system-associated acyl-CoA thioesterase [Candidatus Muproteobacteria bacterium RBG_16_62_13]|uniref:Tol-pal system-associated acyl-CoA thioesterase n=1 Tax=Candidatus Muproteobacteria bacterium RBG_16_62_13 TaxID=1817756 RepID=A0A1F6T4F4_9PROT|nr:MAG: tol-pal system-associated acyl-CoA thioesterase [Candidatus Muproteobacteria bacterium RBG_16_62_13]
MDNLFSTPIRVYYEDTDAGGVVYYANYLRFMERARTEWLRALGFEQDELSRDPGVVFAVRSCNLEFRKPARFNELLEVTVRIAARGGASLTFAQQIRRDGTVLCEGEVLVACLDAQRFTPRPLPSVLTDRLPPEAA